MKAAAATVAGDARGIAIATHSRGPEPRARGRAPRRAPLAAAALAAWALASLHACGPRGPAGAEHTGSAVAVDTALDRQAGAVREPSPDAGAPDRERSAGPDTGAMLIRHPDNIQPGLTPQGRLAALRNPREHDARAVEEGKQLFVAYNCADCHGSEGSGAVGPSLQDGRWHFGGTAGEVYESIAEGRPNGMPAWGGRISDRQIWALVAYVRRLSAGQDVSTENFEGATVQRSGH